MAPGPEYVFTKNIVQILRPFLGVGAPNDEIDYSIPSYFLKFKSPNQSLMISSLKEVMKILIFNHPLIEYSDQVHT